VDQAKLFSGKAFVFESSEVDNSSDNTLISMIFKGLSKPVEVDSVKLLNSFIEYDCYKVISRNRAYNIKISFSENCPPLQREADSLNLLSNQVAPQLIDFNQVNIGEKITYLISTQEQSHTVETLGRSFLVNNFSSFLECWKELINSTPPKYSVRDNASDLISSLNFKESFYQDAYEAAYDMSEFGKIESIINNICKNMSDIYDSSILESKYFCHGFLDPSNILWRNGVFKFCNFQKSFSGHYLLDLSQLLLNFGVKGASKRKLIRDYRSYMGVEFTAEEYKACEKLNILMILGQIILRYFTEVYIFESSRPLEFCKIMTLYSHNFNEFNRFDFFSDHKKFLSKMIINPINS